MQHSTMKYHSEEVVAGLHLVSKTSKIIQINKTYFNHSPEIFFFFFPKRILFAASAADECLTFTMFFHIWMWRCYIYMVHTLCWLFFNVRFLLHKKTNQLWISALLYRFWSTCLMYTQQVICCGYDRVKERTIECSVGPPLTPGCLRQMWRGGRKKTGRGWGFLKLARATFWEKKKKERCSVQKSGNSFLFACSKRSILSKVNCLSF